MRKKVAAKDIPAILKHAENVPVIRKYEQKNHQIKFFDNLNNKLGYLRLPIHMVYGSDIDLPVIQSHFYIILLVQSGNSALGLCREDKMIDHKVIRSYMVRKKQGKSQIKHLKTRGKSRAGSRLRLANTYRFFRDIHERLSRYLDNYKIGRIALSCSATLIPYLFSNKIPPSFLKTDHRIFKIPTHVNKPDYRNLLMVHSFLLSGELQAHDTTHPWIDTLLPHL